MVGGRILTAVQKGVVIGGLGWAYAQCTPGLARVASEGILNENSDAIRGAVGRAGEVGLEFAVPWAVYTGLGIVAIGLYNVATRFIDRD